MYYNERITVNNYDVLKLFSYLSWKQILRNYVIFNKSCFKMGIYFIERITVKINNVLELFLFLSWK